MFGEMQFSGLLLCYGPLALIILGFIAFAALTDSQARSKYLRVLDPRADTERTERVRPVVTREVVARTPTGMVVALQPTAETAVPTRAPAAPAQPDNLRRIEGIGPKISRVLQDAGITTFAALAAKTPAELRVILDAAGMTGINDPTSWPEQAGLAARGEWEALEELQARLTGGRQ
ncbi:MAG: DUF4332 domain-containing protein [Anaerolineales bacterium]|nr:DUF4332 domain-containing protein [Anaerolineales bacterium]